MIKGLNNRQLENLHIPLWLVKDTCWMLVWRPLGVMMIVPTVLVAIIITARTYKLQEFYINLAIVFWILANSYWMCSEFFKFEQYKQYALIPFLMGIVSCICFFMKTKGNTTPWINS